MTSIYQQALGAEFSKLHPKMQERFGFDSEDGVAWIGVGSMDCIWRGRFFTLPFLLLGSWRRILFPETGTNVPFTVRNYAYVDSFGRETVTWIRTFKMRQVRRFDAYMVYSAERGCILDYFGTHCHLVAELHASVDERGGLRLRSGAQHIYEHFIGLPFPLAFSGVADVVEWYDEATDRFHIEVDIHNRIWGPLFGYRGTFTAQRVETEQVPANVLPVREESRS